MPSRPPPQPPSPPPPRSPPSKRGGEAGKGARAGEETQPRAGRDEGRPTAAALAARNASYALFAFTVITVLSLLAWFLTADQPWSFSSFVVLLSALLGSGVTALFWRDPTRAHAYGGLAVMAFSLARLASPTMWGSVTAVVVVLVTGLLAIPLILAATVLPRS